MKVAFFIPSLSNKGGLERSTVSLLNTLSDSFQDSIQVFLICFQNEPPAFALSTNVKVLFLNITNYKKQYLKLIYNLRKNIESNNIDIVVSVEIMSLLFTYPATISLKNRPKTVVWEHFNFKNNNNRRLRDWLRVLASKNLDLIITLTERDANTWRKELNPKAKITYIYNISPFDGHTPSYQIESKKAIAIGRYAPVKGFDRLIKAWELYEKKFGSNGWTLDIIGYGEQSEQLQSLIDSTGLNTINLVPAIKEMEYYYSNAGLYCMSSYFEGLSMVMIEAQSYAVPSVAFDIYTGNSEILAPGSGILVKDGDLDAYATAISKLTSNDDLRLTMSNLAEKNSSRFGANDIAKRWLKELHDIQ